MTINQGDQRFDDQDDAQDGRHHQRFAEQERGVEQHADGHEKQHGEGVPERKGSLGGLMSELGFVEDQAGEERPERERHLEEGGGSEGDAERDGQDEEGKQFARAGFRHAVKCPRDEAFAHDQHQRDEQPDLAQRDAHCGDQVSKLRSSRA